MLKTHRLILRRFISSDYDALSDVLGCQAVMKSSIDGALNAGQITDWLDDQFSSYQSNDGIEVLAVVNEELQTLIGYCGLFNLANTDVQREIEIGYRFMQKCWGKGYATEAATAVRDYAFITLNLPRLIALIEPANTRSIRVAEKIGMQYEKDIMLENYDYPDYLYSMPNPNSAKNS